MRTIEGEPLLPGENRGTRFVDDAEHWISVYKEFIRFKEGLLSTVESERAELSEELSAALSVSVVSQLTDQYASLQRRLSFWRDRLSELTQRP